MTDTPTGTPTPTKAQIKALSWFAERDSVALFGVGDPSLKTVHQLKDAGWVETNGREARVFGCTYFRISPAGRTTLQAIKQATE